MKQGVQIALAVVFVVAVGAAAGYITFEEYKKKHNLQMHPRAYQMWLASMRRNKAMPHVTQPPIHRVADAPNITDDYQLHDGEKDLPGF